MLHYFNLLYTKVLPYLRMAQMLLLLCSQKPPDPCIQREQNIRTLRIRRTEHRRFSFGIHNKNAVLCAVAQT